MLTSAKPHLTNFIPSGLQRAAAELQTKLGHSSSFHEHCNIPALKAAVSEVERLIHRLSEIPGLAAAEAKARIEQDWKLGWSGIVKGPVKVV